MTYTYFFAYFQANTAYNDIPKKQEAVISGSCTVLVRTEKNEWIFREKKIDIRYISLKLLTVYTFFLGNITVLMLI